MVTGIIYALIGPTVAGGYLVYSWLAFWGIYFCYVAFRTALPAADHRRYAVLVFFLPSILFWPSAISKETPMILCTGLTLLGATRLLNRMSRWVCHYLSALPERRGASAHHRDPDRGGVCWRASPQNSPAPPS